MNAVANEITGSDGIQASADERIVAALLDKGQLKDADLIRGRRLQEEAGGSLRIRNFAEVCVLTDEYGRRLRAQEPIDRTPKPR